MSTALFWPLVCLVAGLLLLFVEVFVPSGGLIGLLSLGLLAISLWLAFTQSALTGVSFLFALAVLMPLTLAIAVQLWPKTPMGKLLILKPPEPDELEPEPYGPRLEHLIGQFGRTLTPLRPSGVVEFDGRRHDGLAEEGLIQAGLLVQAIAVRGNQIVVRPASEDQFDDLMRDI